MQRETSMLSTVLKFETRMTASVLKQDPNACCLSVVVWLDKGDYPEDLRFAVINSVLLSLLYVLDILSTVLGVLVIHNCSK